MSIENTLNRIADALEAIAAGRGIQQEETKDIPSPPPPPAPYVEELEQISLEEANELLKKECERLNGDTTQIHNIIKKYGASNLSLVDPSKYPLIVRDAKECQITPG